MNSQTGEQTIAMPQSSLNRPTERGSTNMGSTDDRRWEPANGAGPLRAGVAPAEARDDSRPPPAGATTHPDHRAADVSTDPPPATSPPASVPPSHPWRKALLWAGAVAGLALGAYFLAPTVKTMLDTVSTDDAYVNGHVTYVAPRVAGQVSHVLVDDNERVKKGDLLVQLDKEPYQVQVDIKKAALVAAEAELMAARSQVRGILAQAGSLRWKLQRSIEDVDDSVALLRARVAALRSKEASFERAAPTWCGPGPSSAATRSPARTSTSASRPSGRPRPRSSRPSRKSMRRGSRSASPRTPRRAS